MKELVEVIAKSLVENPDEVVVTETEKEDAVIVELKVGPADMGKVIGRQGRIAKAIRTVVKAASSKSSERKDRMNVYRAEQAMLRMVREGDIHYEDALAVAASVSTGAQIMEGWKAPSRQATDDGSIV